MSTEIEFTLMMQIDARNPIDRLVVKPRFIGVGRYAYSSEIINRNSTLTMFKAMTVGKKIRITLWSGHHETIHRFYALKKEGKKMFEFELIAKSQAQNTPVQTNNGDELFKIPAVFQQLKDSPHVFADLTLNDVEITSIVPGEYLSGTWSNPIPVPAYDITFDAAKSTGSLVTSG